MRLLSGMAAVAALVVLYGCGSTSGSFLATALGVSVNWPPQGGGGGRVFDAPAAAQSGIFSVSGATAGGHDNQTVFNRDVGDAGGTRRYTLPGEYKVGEHSYVMTFCSEPGGQGSAVAIASGTFTVFPNGTSSLDQTTIVPTGTIQSVTVDANQVIQVGQTKPITFTARDAQGNVVAIAPGGAQATVVSGGSFLTASGTQGTGVAPGVAGVTITVNPGSPNAVTSPQQTITVEGIVKSVTFSPASVPGGSQSTGTVTLNSAAPLSGVVVGLTSGNTSVATVPATVTVPAGATSATFTANTVPVTSDTNVAVTAAVGSVTTGGTLTVAAPVLTDLSLSPNPVIYGSPVTGTVTLSGNLPPNTNATVNLSSSNQNVATVPTTVVVSGGSSSATFTINTDFVSISTDVTITASYNGVTKQRILTVKPPPGPG